MTHYIAIIVPTDVGEWRVIFPDVPGCEARGSSLEDAKLAGVSRLMRCLKANGSTTPQPRDLSTIAKDREWMSRNDIDFSRAVVAMVPVSP